MYRQLPALFIPALFVSLTGMALAADGENPPPEPTHNHRGEGKRIILENGHDATITLWKPDLSTEPLPFEHGGVTLPNTGMDNYHAILAEKDWGDHKEVVIRYEYRHGPPSKQSPSILAAKQKTEFEIVPDPIPREHYRYHSRQDWGFLLRFQGQPVGGHQVELQTANGSHLTATTDATGRVVFRIPDDFPGLVEGERDRRMGDFAVSSEYLQGDRRYTTQLSADYRVSPVHWQSTRLGLLVVGIGFIAGGFIGRVKRAGGGK
ncbi:MAG: hypothetical protein ABW096_17315 [Candidatus Thiodiazotropha sp.]